MQVNTGKGVKTTKLYYELFSSQRGYILQLWLKILSFEKKTLENIIEKK